MQLAEQNRIELIAKNPKSFFTVADVYTGMELVYIPAGKFTMGISEPSFFIHNALPLHNDSIEGRHSVLISKDFYLGKYEVTQAQWKKVMGNNPSHFKGYNLPVEQVSWNDIQTFIKKMNQQTGKKYRLPTEAEWEYAARAGTTTPYSFGYNITFKQANFIVKDDNDDDESEASRKMTLRVGSLPPNMWGLHEMHGNVREWVSDLYSRGYYRISPTIDPQGPSKGSSRNRDRVTRGGGWNTRGGPLGSYYFCELCLSTSYAISPEDSNYGLGFRLARTL